MDWIPSASRHNQSEALVIGKRFSKGDPLEFPAVSVIEVRKEKEGDQSDQLKGKFRRFVKTDSRHSVFGAEPTDSVFPEALEIQTGSENHSRYLALRSANKEVILDDFQFLPCRAASLRHSMLPPPLSITYPGALLSNH
ncbi:hypothetical protein KY289_020370 [Solanum tuberosum]|nr:hypothetical protein KY289_020370 [Solanum tuberosum]